MSRSFIAIIAILLVVLCMGYACPLKSSEASAHRKAPVVTVQVKQPPRQLHRYYTAVAERLQPASPWLYARHKQAATHRRLLRVMSNALYDSYSAPQAKLEQQGNDTVPQQQHVSDTGKGCFSYCKR